MEASTFETFPGHSLVAGIYFWRQSGKQGLINTHT